MHRLWALVDQPSIGSRIPRAALPCQGGDMKATESQQVTWESVHELILPILNQVNDWPTAGTPAWCSLAHGDPRKWAALLDGAQHHALRLELNQRARADASRTTSAAGAPLVDDDLLSVRTRTAVDWKTVGQQIRRRHEAHIYRVVDQ